MSNQKEIETLEDVQLLVDNFYGKVREDKLLKDIFNHVIQDQWPEHLEKMYRFWQTVLLNEHTYFGSPFVPHAKLPLSQKHFDRWLQLFRKTLNDHFFGNVAKKAEIQAERMAVMFLHKIEHYRSNPNKEIL
ncbi:MAG: group III truncated hemoglobin [Vicingaceae bacterium]